MYCEQGVRNQSRDTAERAERCDHDQASRARGGYFVPKHFEVEPAGKNKCQERQRDTSHKSHRNRERRQSYSCDTAKYDHGRPSRCGLKSRARFSIRVHGAKYWNKRKRKAQKSVHRNEYGDSDGNFVRKIARENLIL